ncbi:MAG TPA: RtcB family protein, partial [bacterium]|nr:RtcB family protein [bacterium]
MDRIKLQKIDDWRWRIPREGGMRVEGRVYTDEKMLPQIEKDKALQQVENVAHLPGILNYSLAMPDIHWGYGFPIGGVAAVDIDRDGVISPGGIGYDINCGIRLVRTNLSAPDIKPHLSKLMAGLFSNIPSGVGS